MATTTVLCLMGPTATGKTDLAVELSEVISAEIISVDSALIYRGMDIGTAKPDAELLKKAPHRLIDIREATESYSAADFCTDAEAAIDEIAAKGKVPLLVGGTMLYFKALQEGLADLPSANSEIREKIVQEAESKGWAYLHERLAKIDPESARRIHPNDPQRLQRALEVYEVSGVTLTEFWQRQQSSKLQNVNDENDAGHGSLGSYTTINSRLPCTSYRYINIGLNTEHRSELHQRIEMRFHHMLEHGFVDEVRALRARGDLDLSMPSMRCVGYRQVWEYLDGQYDYEQMVDRGIIATRQLAKRQVTWLRRWRDLHWLTAGQQNLLAQALKICDSAII